MWFFDDLDRLSRERDNVANLFEEADWLLSSEWAFEGAKLVLRFRVVVGETHEDLIATFPDHYPALPPAVRPIAPKRLSEHQYGDSGDLCLELGPDNWNPAVHCIRDIVESTERLLRLEASTELPSEEIPSRHELTEGQQLRLTIARFCVTPALIKKLEELDASEITAGSICFTYHDGFVKASVMSLTINGEEWSDETAVVDKNAFGRPCIVSQQPQPAPAGVHSYQIYKHKEKQEWILESYFADGSNLTYETIMLDVNDAMARVGAEQNSENANIVAVIGLGSIGSNIAISLARSGVKNFLLIDDDLIHPANLVRHDSDWRDVGLHKVDYVKERLNNIFSDISVITRKHRIGGQEAASSADSLAKAIAGADLIIDASANEEVAAFCSYIAAKEKISLVWMQVFAGGAGGVLAKADSREGPDPYKVRAAINSYYEAHPVEGKSETRDYATQNSEGGVLPRFHGQFH